VKEIKYLEKAVGLILAIISIKLGASTFDIELLTPLQSLVLVVSLLGGGVLLSAIEANNLKK
jgi:predicted tellurium resistance membrane protein TerC